MKGLTFTFVLFFTIYVRSALSLTLDFLERYFYYAVVIFLYFEIGISRCLPLERESAN